MPKLIENIFKVTTLENAKADLAVKTMITLPRSQLRALFQNGCVTLNGKVITNPGTKMRVGDVLTLRYEAGRKYKETKEVFGKKQYSVVFEDKHIIVVEKNAGLLTIPTLSGDENDTLLDQLNSHRQKDREVQVVHRLDRDTSGLLVFAKTHGLANKLKEQFKERKPERLYHAFVRGHVKERSGKIESYLSTDEDLNQYSVDEDETGKLAITHYTVEEYLDDATWVTVQLETGRRNQIRVHFAEMGHPVIGDRRYKVKQAAHPLWKDYYLALHAMTLGLQHPLTRKKLFFKSEMPLRMAKFLERVRLPVEE